MDTLGMAKSIESQGRDYYKKLAQDSPLKELSGIFNFLANEEQRHFEIFDAMQRKEKITTPQKGNSSAEAKKVFAAMSKQFAIPETVYDYTKTYQHALELEEKSIDLYEAMLTNASTLDEKRLLAFLIEEEQKHEHLLDHLIEFVNEPNVFLENAEFNHLDLAE
jgi:rubrerythrin